VLVVELASKTVKGREHVKHGRRKKVVCVEVVAAIVAADD
jgi:hypothetical protein